MLQICSISHATPRAPASYSVLCNLRISMHSSRRQQVTKRFGLATCSFLASLIWGQQLGNPRKCALNYNKASCHSKQLESRLAPSQKDLDFQWGTNTPLLSPVQSCTAVYRLLESSQRRQLWRCHCRCWDVPSFFAWLMWSRQCWPRDWPATFIEKRISRRCEMP